jgi:hypothetical protein
MYIPKLSGIIEVPWMYNIKIKTKTKQKNKQWDQWSVIEK